jgi:hypothetical protein
LASSELLVATASALETVGSKPSSKYPIQETLVAQVSAVIYYKSMVMSELTTSKSFKAKFNKVIFDQINEDFGSYIDAQARTKPKSLHHVYEWKKTGMKEARLFNLNKIDSGELGFGVSYKFNQSKTAVPNKYSKRKNVFKNKAEIMEKGITVVVSPRFAERLVFDSGLGYTVFMPKGASVTITKPGGVAAKQSFETAYKRFFTSNLVNLSIKKSGFQKIFTYKMKDILRVPREVRKVKYVFSGRMLRAEAKQAIENAFGGLA